MGKLTTHVLDTASGKPAVGMTIELSVLEGTGWEILKTLQTNADGRTDPLRYRAGGRKLSRAVAVLAVELQHVSWKLSVKAERDR